MVDNHISLTEMDRKTMGVNRYFGLISGAPANTWENVAQREVNYQVKGTGTMLEVIVSDVFGVHALRQGPTCSYRIVMNGVPVDKEVTHHSSVANGWFIEPTVVRAYVPSSKIVKGTTYNFKLQWNMNPAHTSECLIGWENGWVHNTFSVSETMAAPELSLATFGPIGAWPDTRPRSTGWENIAGRSLKFQKQYPDSVIRVTYYDGVGYYMNGPGGQSETCRQRVLFNGSTHGTRMQVAHKAGHAGWRIRNRAVRGKIGCCFYGY